MQSRNGNGFRAQMTSSSLANKNKGRMYTLSVLFCTYFYAKNVLLLISHKADLHYTILPKTVAFNLLTTRIVLCKSSTQLAYIKISHLVASLPTTRQQVEFALLVPSCQQVSNNLLTICNNLVDIIRLFARLFQQVRYSHDITILLQPCVVNLVTFLLYYDCIRLVGTTL
jgi:hypothetical protein